VKINYYTKYGCPLCDQGLTVLHGLDGLEVELIDIEADPVLLRDYGIRIPVLACQETGKELGWPFSRTDVISFIDRCRGESAA
jgi:hypothetical protein